MPAEVVSGTITAVSQLIDTIIKHVDKNSEELRKLDVREINRELVKLSADIDELIMKVKENG